MMPPRDPSTISTMFFARAHEAIGWFRSWGLERPRGVNLRVVAVLMFAASNSRFALAAAPATAPAGELPGVAPLDGKLDGKGKSAYEGVVPGAETKNPLPLPHSGAALLIWTGFQAEDQGAKVFLQTTQAVRFDSRLASGPKPRITVFLRNCRVHLANNSRNLDTRFFASPVAGVKARQRGKDVELEIVLKESVDAQPHTQPGPDGTQFVVLDFPPGKAVADRDHAPRPRDAGPEQTGSGEPSP